MLDVVGRRVLACELVTVALLACCCCPGCDTTTGPTANAACAPAGSSASTDRPTATSPGPATITDLSDTVTSGRAIAVGCGPELTFLDPVSGARRETIAPFRSVSPTASPTGSTPGPTIGVVTTLLVDVEDDTYAVFLYHANHPQDGLTPARTERRVRVHARRGGRVLDRPVVLPGERDAYGSWSGVTVAGTDPRGYVALNLTEYGDEPRDVIHVLAVRPDLRSWSRALSQDSLTDPSIRALAVHRGVLLTSRVAEESAELHAYDVATGRARWQRRFGVESLTVPDHPGCAVGRDDTFVVMGRWIPLVVSVGSGRSMADRTYRVCMKIDPLGSTGAYGGSGRGGALVAVNLTNGRQRWALDTERVDALGLRLISVYDDRVYVTTRGDRLTLDARTGREVDRGWRWAPIEHHDGWIVAYDPARDANVVIPG
jgi:outer membrane protein assembly factor BamB